MRFAFQAFHKRSSKPRFANTCLAGQEHHLAFASLRLRPAPQQQFEFFLATNKLCQSARVQRFEAAFNRNGSQDTPSPYRSAHALEVLCRKVLQFEEIAEQLPRALRDDNGIWFSDALKSCSEIRRLADDAALMRFSRSNSRRLTTNSVAMPTQACRTVLT